MFNRGTLSTSGPDIEMECKGRVMLSRITLGNKYRYLEQIIWSDLDREVQGRLRPKAIDLEVTALRTCNVDTLQDNGIAGRIEEVDR